MAFRQWIPVVSSRFTHVDFDPATNRLFVKFTPSKTGDSACYSYSNITPAQWAEFMDEEKTPSKGKWFSAIKNDAAAYPFKRLGVETADGEDVPAV
jgi:hypothetical protein